MDSVSISYPLAFLAGLVSFLAPCVLPLVPSYVTFVSGMTLEELRDGTARDARKAAVIHALLFGVGFGLVFMTMGAVATVMGQNINRALPMVSRLGGVLVLILGLFFLGVIKLPGLGQEKRIHLARRPEGFFGSLIIGIVFGAGWTPCMGPILGTILLWASMETTMLRGTLLLGTYALGLGLPFVIAAVAFNWYLAGVERVRAWVPHLQRITGILMVVLGLLMITGRFATLSAFLADFGQIIDLEL